MATGEHAYPLSAAEIARFVEDGALLLPAAFPAEAAAAMVRATFEEGDPPPTLGRWHDREPRDSVDLHRPATWPGDRLDLETGRNLPIATFAPRLWGAIRSLIGEEQIITRPTMGEQWILRARLPTNPARTPPPLPHDASSLEWHIDTCGPRSSLAGRRDALVLLILWSDCEPGGGGPVYSLGSFDHVVAQLQAHPEGIDTRSYDWGRGIVKRCGDARELVGRAGDVLITHPFVLHAGQPSFSGALRILENPTITVSKSLAYYSDHPSPSPVEQAVIRRLTRPRPRPADDVGDATRYLIDHHADYFLPGRSAWRARVDQTEQALVHTLDRFLAQEWVSRFVEALPTREDDGPLARAELAIARLQMLLVNQRALKGHLSESTSDADFEPTTFARLLRGFVSCEGQNHLLGLVLAAHFVVNLFDARCPTTGLSSHALLRVGDGRRWFFADAWSSHPIFHVESRSDEPYPGTPAHADLLRAGARHEDGLLPREWYEDGWVIEPVLAPPRRIRGPRLAAALDRVRARAQANDAASAAPDTAWQALLRVRARHVENEVSGETSGGSISEAYRALLSTHRLGGATRAIVEIFRERAGRRPDESA